MTNKQKFINKTRRRIAKNLSLLEDAPYFLLHTIAKESLNSLSEACDILEGKQSKPQSPQPRQ